MSDPILPLFEIRNFTEFLENCLTRRVLDYKLKPLTKPGDNYGSVMQSIDVKVARKNSDEVSERNLTSIYFSFKFFSLRNSFGIAE